MRLNHLGLIVVSVLSIVLPTLRAQADEAAAPKGLAQSDWSSIRAAYEAHRHAVVADESKPGHYRARNPGQRWITTFDGRGFSKTPNAGLDGGGWTWGLDLISYGRGEKQQTISGTAKIQPSGTRVEYVWSESLTEWYINDQRGFEHGYTLRDRPEGASGVNANGGGMLHFTLAVRGELVPRVSENGRDVAFQTSTGGAALTYNNLRVFDADGVHLAASFQAITTTTGTHALRLTIDDTHARYPLTIDPTAQQAFLKAFLAPTTESDQFGSSVAVSGDTVVVGAQLEDSNATGVNGNQADDSAINSGAVYVFVRTGSTWTQQAYLKASNTGVNDQFGESVAVSGDTVVVGAYAEDSSASGVNGNQADNSALTSGAAYIFIRSPGGTTWTQQAYLKASNAGAGDLFGISVAVSGDTVVVGAVDEESNATGVNGNQADSSASGAGAAYVFVRSGITWTQQAYLKASNTGANDSFGSSVAVSGDTVVVGADLEDSNATGINGDQSDNSAGGSGAAYVFVRAGVTWTQQAYFKASNTGASDFFGRSVGVSGDTIVVGADGEDSNATGVNGDQADNTAGNSGAAYVFIRSGTTWSQQAYLKASNTGANDQFGNSVAVSGDAVVVGASLENSNATGINGNQANNSAADSGAVYVFFRSGATWTQLAYVKASNTGAGDFFGRSVAVSGDTVVVGAPLEDSNAAGVNGNDADNSAADSGATYVFVRTGPIGIQQAYFKAPPLTSASDSFGSSVAVSVDTVVVGAPNEDSNATGVNGNEADNSAADSGAAYVFVRIGTTWTQQAYLKASNTGASDNFGVSVAVSGDTVVVGADSEDSSATGVNGNGADNSDSGSGAAYVFVRSGTTWTQQAYLKASNTGRQDSFGTSVAVSFNTVVVGAHAEDSNATGVNGNQTDNSASDSGAAYVFVRSGTTWSQQAYLKASNAGASDAFGISVAVAGNTVVVGAYFEDSNATGVNGNQADNSLSGSGAAYVFVRSGTTWNQQAYLKASNAGASDLFGNAVAVSGGTVVVGADGENSNATGVNGDQADNTAGNSGAAYVFIRSGTTWSQQAYLKASNTGAGDLFGNAVGVSGDTVVVGAWQEDSNATGVDGNQANESAFAAGAAYVFVRSGTNWTQQAYLKASNTGAGDAFGRSVAVSGDTVVVGADGESSSATGVNGNQDDNSAADSGAAYVFVLGLPTPTSPLATPASVCPSATAALSVTDPGAGIVIDWFTGSCGGTLIGTGNPFNVTPAATTTYYARARRTADGNTSDECASVVVTVSSCSCSLADIVGGGPDGTSPDGTVDGSDFIAFINSFGIGDASIDPLADIAGGGPTGEQPDGTIDGSDFIAFINAWQPGVGERGTATQRTFCTKVPMTCAHQHLPAGQRCDER